jgi:hypothetical protein
VCAFVLLAQHQHRHTTDMALVHEGGLAGRCVNGTNNFCSEFASPSIFKDMVCNYSNLTNMDVDIDIVYADIRLIC